MAEAPVQTTITISVVYSPGPRQVDEQTLHLPAGATVRDALKASTLGQRFPELDPETADVGIWGSAVSQDQLLQHRDRIEIYRPLKVDPKTARRERFQKQGARGAGLFAKKRPGAKAGY